MDGSKAYDQFNQVRYDAIFLDGPEYGRYSSLATDGIIIDKPVELILRSIPEPPRKLQLQLPSISTACIEGLGQKQWYHYRA